MQPLLGPTVFLGALGAEHVEAVLAACSDWSELAAFGPPYWRPRSEAELRRKIGSASGPSLATEYNFVVRGDGGEGPLMGECSVHAIDYRNRAAQVGVCIWAPGDRHRGYGRAAVTVLVDWATGYLGLRRLEAWIVDGNEPSLKLFTRLGFQHEGTLRERYLAAGVRHDVHVLARIVHG